jgi:hypothetical protein
VTHTCIWIIRELKVLHVIFYDFFQVLRLSDCWLKSSKTPPEINNSIIQENRIPFLEMEVRYPVYKIWTFSVASVSSAPFSHSKTIYSASNESFVYT